MLTSWPGPRLISRSCEHLSTARANETKFLYSIGVGFRKDQPKKYLHIWWYLLKWRRIRKETIGRILEPESGWGQPLHACRDNCWTHFHWRHLRHLSQMRQNQNWCRKQCETRCENWGAVDQIFWRGYTAAASHYGRSCSAEIDRGGYGRIWGEIFWDWWQLPRNCLQHGK